MPSGGFRLYPAVLFAFPYACFGVPGFCPAVCLFRCSCLDHFLKTLMCFSAFAAVAWCAPASAVNYLELAQARDSFTDPDATSSHPAGPSTDVPLPTLLRRIGRSSIYTKSAVFGAGTVVYGNVFASHVITVGANTHVYGNLVSGGYITVDANTLIDAGMYAGDAITIGADTIVNGQVHAGAAITVGARSTVDGAITSTAASTIGANAVIGGPISAGAAAGVGAGATVNGAINSGAAVTIGAGSTVTGSIGAVSDITLGTGAHSGDLLVLISNSVAGPDSTLTDVLTPQGQDIAMAQHALTNLGLGTPMSDSIVSDITLLSGLYSAPSLSTTAGVTITLDAQNKRNQVFVFNILGSLTAGADTKVRLINAGANTSIIWNVGSFASLGANTEFLGMIMANGYVTLGAGAKVSGQDGASGGAYSATSYVVTGADSIIGTSGSGGSGTKSLDPPEPIVDVGDIPPLPEPSTWVLMVSGFGLVGVNMRRRAKHMKNVAA